jgi:hypothetical protein
LWSYKWGFWFAYKWDETIVCFGDHPTMIMKNYSSCLWWVWDRYCTVHIWNDSTIGALRRFHPGVKDGSLKTALKTEWID